MVRLMVSCADYTVHRVYGQMDIQKLMAPASRARASRMHWKAGNFLLRVPDERMRDGDTSNAHLPFPRVSPLS